MRMSPAVITASRLRSSAEITVAVRPLGQPLLERLEHRPELAAVGGIAERDAVHARVHRGVPHAGRAEDDRNRLLHDGIGARETGAGRHRDRDRDIVLVLHRDESTRRVEHPPAGERNQSEEQHAHQHAPAQQHSRGAAVAVGQPLHPAVEPLADAMQPRPAAVVPACDASCGFSIFAASAGDSVSDTTSEITVAEAMVSANCL